MNFLAELAGRLSDLERRVAQQIRYGAIPEKDGVRVKNGQVQVRAVIGKDKKGKDVLSGWTPWSQHAGDLKIHTPPSPGMQVRLISPNGEPRQAAAEPFTWSNSKKPPNESLKETTITLGAARIDIKKDRIRLAVGGSFIEVSAAGVEQSGGGGK